MLDVQIPEFLISGTPQQQIVAVIVHFRHKGEQLFSFPGHLLHIHVGVKLRPFHQLPLRKFQAQGAGFQIFHQLGRQLVRHELTHLFLFVMPALRLQGF